MSCTPILRRPAAVLSSLLCAMALAILSLSVMPPAARAQGMPGAPGGAMAPAMQGGPGAASGPGAPGGPGGPAGGPPLPAGLPPMPPQEPVVLVPVVEIVDGQWRAGDPAAAAQVRGQDGRQALRIVSTRDQVNGLIVRGRGQTTLKGARIEIRGRGKSDFDGIAAGLLVKDDAQLTLHDARIVTRGVVASAITATDRSTLEVRRSHLVAEGGPLPSGYTRRIGPGMMEPPTPLGLSGTARTTLALGSAKVRYVDSHIEAEAWGALSTDAARGATLQADRCTIVVRRSGYGTYSDNGAAVILNDSRMTVPTFGGVIAGQASLTLNRVVSQSGGNTVMIHSVMGQPQEVGTLHIDGGTLHSTNAAIVVKSANADIVLRRTTLRADNGDLLLGVANDDAFATRTQGAVVPGIRALVQDSTLQGHLVHLDKDRAMRVRLQGSRLQGRVQDVELALDAGSHWLATADSRVRLAPGTPLERIDARPGVTITALAQPGGLAVGEHRLASGGRLLIQADPG
ncbi:hypothetical protein [Pseudaquabacterium rugosum]|uniref:Uncharacterized protein n=1 Tax=Pseudaquabacterium rugosum TaxID=2984194 RepID=A0ABU9BF47_9BURK